MLFNEYSCFARSPNFSTVLLELTKRVDNNALINAYSIWTVCVIHGTLLLRLVLTDIAHYIPRQKTCSLCQMLAQNKN